MVVVPFFLVLAFLLGFCLLFLMPRRKRGTKRRGKRRHVRFVEAIARRVPLGNGCRLYIRSAATETVGSDILAHTAVDIAKRLGGIAG